MRQPFQNLSEVQLQNLAFDFVGALGQLSNGLRSAAAVESTVYGALGV